MTTRTDPMMPFGTGTVGDSRHEPEQSLHQEGLGPTQTKPAIFDADHIAWAHIAGKRTVFPLRWRTGNLRSSLEG